ncbi:MAG: hypothetical protein RIR31_720, partial [Bacteroidota bacterium]|jgi:predicted RND superfamily exporter protein
MFTSAKKLYKIVAALFIAAIICAGFIYATKIYTQTDFGKTFGAKAIAAEKKLATMQQNFALCSNL